MIIVVSIGVALLMPAVAREPEGDALFEAFLEAVAHMEHDESLYVFNVVGGGFLHSFNEDTPSRSLFDRYMARFVLATGGTEEEWLDMSPFERWVMWTTYLEVHELLARGRFSEIFGTFSSFSQRTWDLSRVGLGGRHDEQSPEAWEALYNLMYWQYNFLIENGMPYNFFAGTSAPPTLFNLVRNRPTVPETGFTEAELEEIEAVIEELVASGELDAPRRPAQVDRERPHREDESTEPSFPWALLLAVAIIAVVIVVVVIAVRRVKLDTTLKMIVGGVLGGCSGVLFFALMFADGAYAVDDAEFLLHQDNVAYYYQDLVVEESYDEYESVYETIVDVTVEDYPVVYEYAYVSTSQPGAEYSYDNVDDAMPMVARVSSAVDIVGGILMQVFEHSAEGIADAIADILAEDVVHDAPPSPPTPSPPAQTQAPRQAPRPAQRPPTQPQAPAVPDSPPPSPPPPVPQGCQDPRHGQGGIRALSTQVDEFNRPVRETFQYFCGCRFDRVHERNIYGRIIRTITVPN